MRQDTARGNVEIRRYEKEVLYMEGDVGRKVIQGKTEIESEILYSIK